MVLYYIVSDFTYPQESYGEAGYNFCKFIFFITIYFQTAQQVPVHKEGAK